MTQTCKSTCCDLGEVLTPGIFKALCDPSRIAILARLAGGCEEMSVGEIARCCPVHMSVVSRHLGILRHAGIVRAVRRGKQVMYRIEAQGLVKALRTMADALERCCGKMQEKANRGGEQGMKKGTTR